MKEQSIKKTPVERESLASEKLEDEQLEEVSGGNFTNVDDRLSHLETRTVVQSDKGTEPGPTSGEVPGNAG